MLILGLTKTTLLDYPERVACTIFLGGCNFRCPFCHNKELVFAADFKNKTYSEAEIFSFLEKRQNILTGVCITGGEPTLNKELPDFIAKIKALGYKVKLDTNGSNPDMLSMLINENLIDYCAMDIKNSPEKYAFTAGVSADTFTDISVIDRSIKILLSQSCAQPDSFSYEFRTTIVRELHEEADIISICKWISGANAYYLQSYAESEGVIKKGWQPHDEQTLKNFVKICTNYIPNTMLRGV